MSPPGYWAGPIAAARSGHFPGRHAFAFMLLARRFLDDQGHCVRNQTEPPQRLYLMPRRVRAPATLSAA
jgi:hypothetical protein